VEELWDSMCTAVINLTSKGLGDVQDAEALIKIKTIIALFIQTMEVRNASSHHVWALIAMNITKGNSGLGVYSDNVG
jgi:hypothetical protein